jgi:hypothetical protein
VGKKKKFHRIVLGDKVEIENYPFRHEQSPDYFPGNIRPAATVCPEHHMAR